jgi:hypothetical protein
MYRIVAVVWCHRQTFVNMAMNSRVRKYLEIRGQVGDCSFLHQGCPVQRNGGQKCTKRRLLEATLRGDIPVWTVTSGQWHSALPQLSGATVSGCGRSRFVHSW